MYFDASLNEKANTCVCVCVCVCVCCLFLFLFFTNTSADLDDNVSMLSRPFDLLRLIIDSGSMINTQKGELYFSDVMKETFSSGLCSDIYELISFKLDMMPYSSKLYIVISG